MKSKIPNKDTGKEGNLPFVGIIEDLMDPLELGRIRVRVVNQNDNDTPTPPEDLQWCTVLIPMTSASSGGAGTSPTWVQVGSKVVGIYLDGRTKRVPLIIGTFYTIPEMDINKHGVSALARGENIITKEVLGPEPESPYKAEYPYNKVMTTPGGHVVEFDDTPGAERVHLYHKSGTYIEVDFEGRMVRKVIGNDIVVVAKDSDVHIEGKSNIHVVGDATLKVDGNFTSDVGGDYTITAGGNMKVTASRIDLN